MYHAEYLDMKLKFERPEFVLIAYSVKKLLA